MCAVAVLVSGFVREAIVANVKWLIACGTVLLCFCVVWLTLFIMDRPPRLTPEAKRALTETAWPGLR